MPLESRSVSASARRGSETMTPSSNTHGRPKIDTPVPPPHAAFHVGFCEDANLRRRRRMEDAHAFMYDFAERENCGFFGIYDGHGGKTAADWCGVNLHRILAENWKRDPKGRMAQLLDRTFMECDEQLDPAHGIFSGCTAIVAVIVAESVRSITRTLYTANVGDARAVLCRNGKAMRLSFDHQARVPEEKRRIKECGGLVINDRVNGTLAVTRALGDASMKEFITGRPYTTETHLRLPEEDAFLILACDGLWDICSDQEACDYIAADIDDPARCAELLVDFALEQGSTDNLSVIVVKLSAPRLCSDDDDEDDKVTHHDS